MADSAGQPKKWDIFRAFIDLIILTLLLIAAGFGGYWYGMHERLAPVELVAGGTPGAVTQEKLAAADKNAGKPDAAQPGAASQGGATQAATSNSSAPAKPEKKAETKHWLSSSGVDFIGYSIVVSINGTQVDSFFGPGKIVDITKHVHNGKNEVSFEAKQLGKDYNKHSGDAGSTLIVQVVSGPKITTEFDRSSVAVSYARNASETEDFNDVKHFTIK